LGQLHHPLFNPKYVELPWVLAMLKFQLLLLRPAHMGSRWDNLNNLMIGYTTLDHLLFLKDQLGRDDDLEFQ